MSKATRCGEVEDPGRSPGLDENGIEPAAAQRFVAGPQRRPRIPSAYQDHAVRVDAEFGQAERMRLAQFPCHDAFAHPYRSSPRADARHQAECEPTCCGPVRDACRKDLMQGAPRQPAPQGRVQGRQAQWGRFPRHPPLRCAEPVPQFVPQFFPYLLPGPHGFACSLFVPIKAGSRAESQREAARAAPASAQILPAEPPACSACERATAGATAWRRCFRCCRACAAPGRRQRRGARPRPGHTRTRPGTARCALSASLPRPTSSLRPDRRR